MKAMEMIRNLQKATMAAQSRTNDKTISTRVKDGRVQVGRVNYVGARGDFVPASGWLTTAEAIDELNRL